MVVTDGGGGVKVAPWAGLRGREVLRQSERRVHGCGQDDDGPRLPEGFHGRGRVMRGLFLAVGGSVYACTAGRQS
jgi:hypothetical protein